MAGGAEPKTKFEALKALPIEKRIIALLQLLEQLRTKHFEQGYKSALTRTQQLVNTESKGRAMAYRDTTTFIMQLFGDDLRALLMSEKKEETPE